MADFRFQENLLADFSKIAAHQNLLPLSRFQILSTQNFQFKILKRRFQILELRFLLPGSKRADFRFWENLLANFTKITAHQNLPPLFRFQILKTQISQPQEFEGHILDFGKADFKFQISRKFASNFYQNLSTPKFALTFQISDFEGSNFPISRISGNLPICYSETWKMGFRFQISRFQSRQILE